MEERVLAGLTNGPKKPAALLKEIDPNILFTKQSFYWALRKLKAEEAITIYKGVVSLNSAWVRLMAERVRRMEAGYGSPDAPGVLGLREGESVSYTFADMRYLDTFWGHAQNLLVSQTPASEPVYSYDPHYWFYIARKETEEKLVDDIATSGRQFLMTVGGTTPLDKELKREFYDDNRQYHIEKIFDKESYYVVVIGSYVTEVTLDPDIAKRIAHVYETHSAGEAGATTALKELLAVKGRHKIKIGKNSRKAKLLKARLGKPFFIRS